MAPTGLLETPPPVVSSTDAVAIAGEIYGLGSRAVPLPGERDRNFLLTADGESFFLKIANPAEQIATLDMVQQALLHVGRWDPELPVPRPIPTRRQTLVGATLLAGKELAVILTSALDGSTLEDHRSTAELREHSIELLARLDLALRTFEHAELDRQLAWDMRMLPQLRPQLEYLEGAKRKLAARWLRHFDTQVVPRLLRVDTQAIHNDFNPANLLVDPTRGNRIAGIVDFGDMTRGTRVGDLAVAVAYQCLGEEDPAGVLDEAATAYPKTAPLSGNELELLPDLVVSRLVQSLLISAWRAGIHPDNRGYILIHAEPVWEALERFDTLDLAPLRRRLAASIRSKVPQQPDTVEALAARKSRLAPGLRLTYDRPLHAVSAESVWITDTAGVRYLDAYNNVAHVGHSHPRVVAAMTAQAALLNTNTRYLVDQVAEYADRLVSLLPDPLDTVFFANSGSEANDLAWRMARTLTGRTGMIVTEHAYHGSTYLTMATSPEELGTGNLEAWVATIPPPQHGVDPGDCLEAAFERLEQTGAEPAAFACDPVFSSDGIHDLEPGYLATTYDTVRRAGGLCISDEVQAGLGRVGERMWGFAADNVVPDIVTLGKPLGNGHPMAAVVTSAAIATEFGRKGYYFSSFGGNPVSMAVGMAVLDIMQTEQLAHRAEVVGAYLRDRLGDLASRHAMLGAVRGPGMFIGVETIDAAADAAASAADRIQNEMRERGVLIGRTGPEENILKIRPPLVFAEEHADVLLETLEHVLENL